MTDKNMLELWPKMTRLMRIIARSRFADKNQNWGKVPQEKAMLCSRRRMKNLLIEQINKETVWRDFVFAVSWLKLFELLDEAKTENEDFDLSEYPS